VAGLAWAAFSLQGRQATDQLAANARAFLWSLPLALPLAAVAADPGGWSTAGLATLRLRWRDWNRHLPLRWAFGGAWSRSSLGLGGTAEGSIPILPRGCKAICRCRFCRHPIKHEMSSHRLA
jgi:hypothetical protein